MSNLYIEHWLGVISPAQLGPADNPDYAPAGFAGARILRLLGNGGACTLSGLAGGTPGRVITIINISALGGADDIVILAGSAFSAAANRFAAPNRTLAQTGTGGTSQSYWYDGTSSLWREM